MLTIVGAMQKIEVRCSLPLIRCVSESKPCEDTNHIT